MLLSFFRRFQACFSNITDDTQFKQRWIEFVYNLEGYYKGHTKKKIARNLITYWDNVLVFVDSLDASSYVARLCGYGICTYRNKQWPCIIDITVEKHLVKMYKYNFTFNLNDNTPLHQPLNVGQMMNSRYFFANQTIFEVERSINIDPEHPHFNNTYVLNGSEAYGEIYKYRSV